jgi:hypothetical protein
MLFTGGIQWTRISFHRQIAFMHLLWTSSKINWVLLLNINWSNLMSLQRKLHSWLVARMLVKIIIWRCLTYHFQMLQNFWTTKTYQNYFHEETTSRLNSGNSFYHSVPKLLPFHLLFKDVKIKKYKAVTLSLILYGYRTWYPTLRCNRTLLSLHYRIGST